MSGSASFGLTKAEFCGVTLSDLSTALGMLGQTWSAPTSKTFVSDVCEKTCGAEGV